MNKDEINKLMDKGWVIVASGNNRCIVSTTDTYRTIFYMQSLWRHLKDMQEDDVFDKLIWRVERNLLYYYK